MTALRFGTDGIRGRAGVWPCTAEVGVRVGRAAARLAREHGNDAVLIGRDTRPSGAMLEAAVAAGVTAAGADAVLAGVLPTAGVATSLAAGVAGAGVMLTASHNPAADNGFKVLGPGGRKLSADQSAAVEAWLGSDPADASPGRIVDDAEGCLARYHAALAAAAPSATALAGRTIAVDLANGAATTTATFLARTWPDTRWHFTGTGGPINTGCGSEHPEHLAALVANRDADAGIAVDGDADRCLLVDEAGRVVPGDALIALLARGLGVAALAVTVMSTGALERWLPGVRVLRTPVGDKHLADAMAREPIALGGEESGHVLFADGLAGGDGLLTGLRALALADGPLSLALSDFQPLPRVLDKLRVAARPPLAEVTPLVACIAALEPRLGPGGRVFLRYSGTEPVLRILVEGGVRSEVEAVAAEVRRVAAAALAG